MKDKFIAINFVALVVVSLPACINAENLKPNPASINSFEECVKAGYPVMRSMPPRCAVPGGEIFTGVKPEVPSIVSEKLCRDLCGDGICQEMVCMGEGCPCAENKSSCSKDCN